MLVDESVDLLDGVKDEADRLVVVECIDNVGNVLAHAYLNVPCLLCESGIVIDKVGCEDLVDDAVFVCLVEALKTVGEKSKGCECEECKKVLEEVYSLMNLDLEVHQ